ncbi:MAG: septum formation family protein [Gemmatimonadota bacterium]|nr:septum formation family protein [Gemmatimonadota bacterium]
MLEGRSVMTIVGAVVAAAVGIHSAADRNAAGEITSAGAVDAFEVHVGDCFDDAAFASSEISEIPGVPCSDPHDNEIYATFDLPGEWPGDERVEELAYEGCFDRFADAVGKSYEESLIDYTTIYPSKGSWSRLGDREVICVAYHMEYEKLTGSIIGSGL